MSTPTKVDFISQYAETFLVIEREGVFISTTQKKAGILRVGTVAATTCTILLVHVPTLDKIGCFHVTDSETPKNLVKWLSAHIPEGTASNIFLLGNVAGYRSSEPMYRAVNGALETFNKTRPCEVKMDCRLRPRAEMLTTAAVSFDGEVITWDDVFSPVEAVPGFLARSSGQGRFVGDKETGEIHFSLKSTPFDSMMSPLFVAQMKKIPAQVLLQQCSTSPDCEPMYFIPQLLMVAQYPAWLLLNNVTGTPIGGTVRKDNSQGREFEVVIVDEENNVMELPIDCSLTAQQLQQVADALDKREMEMENDEDEESDMEEEDEDEDEEDDE